LEITAEEKYMHTAFGCPAVLSSLRYEFCNDKLQRCVVNPIEGPKKTRSKAGLGVCRKDYTEG
jgi:hypothetical protein